MDAENDAYLNIINLVHDYAEEFGKNFGSPEKRRLNKGVLKASAPENIRE